MYDITLVTQKEYVAPKERNQYINNLLLEDELVTQALQKRGYTVYRTNWDNPDMDWSSTRIALIRGTWDYFHRAQEFSAWLDKVSAQTQLINPIETLRWNMDKHYLIDLQEKGVHIVPTYIIEAGDTRDLAEVVDACGWDKAVLKPAISGGARHTYVVDGNVDELTAIYQELIAKEAMLLQPFQHQIKTKGEVSHMVYNGQYSHTVLKIAKPGDFRVQDDFGGTVHHYNASAEEIAWAEHVAKTVTPTPIYARVDALWDNEDQIALAELELLEPELWFRRNEHAADMLADAIVEILG